MNPYYAHCSNTWTDLGRYVWTNATASINTAGSTVTVSAAADADYSWAGSEALAQYSALYTLTLTGGSSNLPSLPGIGPAVFVSPTFSFSPNVSGYYTSFVQGEFCFPSYLFPGQTHCDLSPVPVGLPITVSLALEAYVSGRTNASAAFTGFQFYDRVQGPDGTYSYQPLTDISYTLDLAESLPQVPEPACLVLTAGGLAVFVAARRRSLH